MPPAITPQAPASILNKPLKLDWRKLAAALPKAADKLADGRQSGALVDILNFLHYPPIKELQIEHLFIQ